jgi:A/G-specific adenine glycosylase
VPHYNTNRMPLIPRDEPESRNLSLITERLERWFRHHQRPLPWRHHYTAYQVWISEVMLQQTRMEVVLPYFHRFVEKYPDVASLAAATESDVLAAWSGLGYYRRARMLHAAAREMMQRHDGNVPCEHQQLLRIPGIGRYTAGAVASIAFNARHPIVDGNVARILSRLEAIDRPMESSAFQRAVWDFSEALVKSCGKPRVFNQALMEVGALICRPANPECGRCPVATHCKARQLGCPESYPRVETAKAPTQLEIPLYLVISRAGRVLMRRESGALMSEMFHLPHGNASLLGRSSRRLFEPGELLGSFRHTVTHRRIRFDVWSATLRQRASGFRWIDPESLHAIPHPSYVRKALALVQPVK